MEAIVEQFAGCLDSRNEDPAVKLITAPLKHLYRCMEKMCLKVSETRFSANGVCDIVR